MQYILVLELCKFCIYALVKLNARMHNCFAFRIQCVLVILWLNINKAQNGRSAFDCAIEEEHIGCVKLLHSKFLESVQVKVARVLALEAENAQLREKFQVDLCIVCKYACCRNVYMFVCGVLDVST